MNSNRTSPRPSLSRCSRSAGPSPTSSAASTSPRTTRSTSTAPRCGPTSGSRRSQEGGGSKPTVYMFHNYPSGNMLILREFEGNYETVGLLTPLFDGPKPPKERNINNHSIILNYNNNDNTNDGNIHNDMNAARGSHAERLNIGIY